MTRHRLDTAVSYKPRAVPNRSRFARKTKPCLAVRHGLKKENSFDFLCVKKVGDDAPISLLVLLNGPRICAGLLVGKHNDTQMAGKWFLVPSA
jgi:hypothetical protein